MPSERTLERTDLADAWVDDDPAARAALADLALHVVRLAAHRGTNGW